MDLLPAVDESGNRPKSRLPDALSAYSIYRSFQDADQAAAMDRARVQDVLDGAPPIPPEKLRAIGQSYRANLNWGEGLADLESAKAAYDDLVNGVDRIALCRTTYGDDSQREEFIDIISEEFHDLVTGWDKFHFVRQLLSQYFIKDGLGVMYWEDTRNWESMVGSIGDFKVPRDAWASDSDLEIALCLRKYPAGKLWKFIENPKAATAVGWNVPAVKELLRKLPGDGEISIEEMQTMFKNNDLYASYSKLPSARIIHFYVREFDGTYSHAMLARDASATEFIFKKQSRFAYANQAFVLFPYGIGTNGYLHSIRGQSHKNFPHIQTSNRLRNAALDATILRTTLLLKGAGAQDRQQLALAYAGPLSVLPDGLDAVTVSLPSVANEVLPVVREMQVLRKQNNGGYLSHVLSPEGGDRTAYEVQAQIAQSNILSSASLDLFYVPWQKWLTETFRRLKRDNWEANEPGGQAALRFRKNVERRGVPWEAVNQVDKVTPIRAVGYGSPAARVAAFGRMMQIFPQLDPVGQNNLIRDVITLNVGPGMASRYASPKAPRLGIPAKIAELENDSMQSGRSVDVLPDEDHFVHGMIHAKDAMMFIQALNQNSVHPFLALKYLLLQSPHLAAHLGYLNEKDLRAPQIAMMKKIQGNMTEVVQGLGKQAAQGQITDPNAAPVQSDNANPNAAQSPDSTTQPSGPGPEEQMKIQKHALDLQMTKERHDLEMNILAREAKQRMALADAEKATKLASGLGGRLLPAQATEAGGMAPPANSVDFTQQNQNPTP